jgi:hypothetical protein
MPGRERAAYKKQLLVLSSEAGFPAEAPEVAGYFGRMSGLPPGLPGGGITGVLPASGVGARICGSTPGGGHSTPSDLASLLPSGSLACPVVVPGSLLGRGRTDFASGAQSSADAVAVGAGGVVGEGGACAAAPCTEAINAKVRRSACFVMWRKRTSRALVPYVHINDFALCDNGSARNAPSAASDDAR